jgi:nucleotide-binding universal stress UspA family protein
VTAYQISEPDPIITAACESARSQLAELESACGADKKVRSEVISEPPSIALSGAAEANEADLIVVGSRGLTGLKHALLGSVAERTLRHAPCSVWVVREEGQDER